MGLHNNWLKLLIIVFTTSCGYSQQKPLDRLLLKAFQTPDSSKIYFASAEKILKTKADTANYLYFKFYTKYKFDEPDSAQYYSDKVIPLLKNLDSLERLRKVYSETHYLSLGKGDYGKALEYSQKALQAAEKLKDTAMISLHLSDISNVYHDFEDYKKGVETGKKAYKILANSKNPNPKYLIFANNVIAINFDDWKKPDSALFYHYKNLKLLKQVDDTLRYGFVFNNIGNTLLKAKKYSEAKKIINRSLAINKLGGRDYNLATNYTNLATIAYEEKNYKVAEINFELANQFAQKSKSIEKIRDVTQQEAWFYKQKGDYKKSLELQEKFYVLRDSVFNDERAAAVAEMETKYETEKKEKDLAQARTFLVEKELEVKQKNTLIFGALGLALVLALLGYLFYNQQKLKNHQLQKEGELKTALARIETQNQLQEQRLRISRDLHDNIGSQLTFIISSIDNLKYGLEGAATSVTIKLGRISEFASQTIYELRDTIWAMNKTDISVEDLQARISNFIEKAKVSSEIDFLFDVDENVLREKPFFSVQGMNVYRIIQEAVNNALKYSEATLISVHISKFSPPRGEMSAGQRGSASFKVEITDNGKGFDIEKTSFGNGLANIKKRAKDLGGNVTITSENGEGTRVRLIF